MQILSCILVVAIMCSSGVVFANANPMWIILFLSIIAGLFSLVIPSIIFVFFILATVLIPNEVLPVMSGLSGQLNMRNSFGLIRLHPATITIFIGSLGLVLQRWDRLIKRVKDSNSLKIITLYFALFLCSALMQTVVFRGFKGIPQILENYLFPFMFFLYLLTLDYEEKLTYLKYYVIVISVVACYGLLEFSSQVNPLYGQAYIDSGNIWYKTISLTGFRVCTTIGHPLKNAVYFLFALPYVMTKVSKPYNIALTLVFFLAILSTGSRAAFVISILSIISMYYNFQMNTVKKIKTTIALFVLVTICSIIVIYSPAGNTLKNRFSTAGDSTKLRIHSIQLSQTLIKENFFMGDGMGNSFTKSMEMLGEFSGAGFENPWLMLVSDVGFITSFLYFCIIFMVFKENRSHMTIDTLSKYSLIAFMSFVLMCSIFNSFGTRNTLNFLLWFIIAIIYKDNPSTKVNIQSREEIDFKFFS